MAIGKATTMMEVSAVSGIAEALGLCGVTETTLAPEEKDALDRDGYLVLPGIMDAAWLDRLRVAFEAAIGQGPRTADARQSGTRHVDGLAGRGAVFGAVSTHPKILAAVYHVLRCPFRLAQLGGRDPLPGYGQQGLHADWGPRAPSEPFRIVTAIWLLDDFAPDNGATRLVPGTHRLLNPPPRAMAAPASHHPEQIFVTASAGSVLVFNGHLWHGGTRNGSNRSRRVLQGSYVARDQYRFSGAVSAAPGGLTPAARYILGG